MKAKRSVPLLSMPSRTQDPWLFCPILSAKMAAPMASDVLAKFWGQRSFNWERTNPGFLLPQEENSFSWKMPDRPLLFIGQNWIICSLLDQSWVGEGLLRMRTVWGGYGGARLDALYPEQRKKVSLSKGMKETYRISSNLRQPLKTQAHPYLLSSW